DHPCYADCIVTWTLLQKGLVGATRKDLRSLPIHPDAFIEILSDSLRKSLNPPKKGKRERESVVHLGPTLIDPTGVSVSPEDKAPATPCDSTVPLIIGGSVGGSYGVLTDHLTLCTLYGDVLCSLFDISSARVYASVSKLVDSLALTSLDQYGLATCSIVLNRVLAGLGSSVSSYMAGARKGATLALRKSVSLYLQEEREREKGGDTSAERKREREGERDAPSVSLLLMQQCLQILEALVTIRVQGVNSTLRDKASQAQTGSGGKASDISLGADLEASRSLAVDVDVLAGQVCFSALLVLAQPVLLQCHTQVLSLLSATGTLLLRTASVMAHNAVVPSSVLYYAAQANAQRLSLLQMEEEMGGDKKMKK
ncbi:hypothetical protein KIPB_009998, partial [Kipferlia bialata]